MTTYPERDNLKILDFAADPEGGSLHISKVNGDPALVGRPLPLAVGGTITVSADGTAVFDDHGLPVLPEGEARYDGIIVTISDGVNEVETPVSLEIFGNDVQNARAVVFGAQTRAGAGGIAVTGSRIVTGNARGDFEIINGHLVVSQHGQGRLAERYIFTFDTGAPILVRIAEKRLDVRTGDELIAAARAAQALNAASRYELVLRAGAEIGTAGATLELADLRMNAALLDANDGVPNGSYDPKLRAEFTGGQLLIRPETERGATRIAGALRLRNCHGIRLERLNFTGAAAAGAPLSYRHDASDYFDGPAATLVQLDLDAGGGDVIVAECRFAAPQDRVAGHWPGGLRATAQGKVIVEECDFARLREGARSNGVNRIALLRNRFEDMLGAAAHLGGTGSRATDLRVEYANNIVLSGAAEASFAGAEMAGLAVGFGDGSTRVDLYAAGNYIAAPQAALTAGSSGARRVSAGIVSDYGNSSQSLTGEIAHNFILVSGLRGIAIDNGDFLTVANNTVVADRISTPFSGHIPALSFSGDTQNGVVRSNVSGGITLAPGAGVTLLGNYTTLDASLENGADSFPSIFTGSFTYEAGRGATYSLPTGSNDEIRTGIDALFDTRGEGLGGGLGYRKIGRPLIEGFPEVGQTLTVKGALPTDFYVWRRNGININGATGASYTLVGADNGQKISVIKAENSQISASADVHVAPMFKIIGNQMLDPSGAPFRPQGFNLYAGNYAFADWGVTNLLSGDDFTATGHGALNAWQTNMLRLNVDHLEQFSFILQGESQERVSSGYTDLFALIDAATRKGIVCLVVLMGWNSHTYSHADGAVVDNGYPHTPNAETEAHALAFIRRMAVRYKDNPYVWLQPYNERGNESGVPSAWKDFSQRAIDEVRETGNRNPVLLCAPNFGQDRTSATWQGTSAFLTLGPQLTGGNIGFDLHLYSRWWFDGIQDQVDYFTAIHNAGLWVVCGEIGGVNGGESSAQADYFATQYFFKSGVSDVGFLIWHGGLSTFNVVTTPAGDLTELNDFTNPTNLTPFGNLVWEAVGNGDTGVYPPGLVLAGIRALTDGSHEVTLVTDQGGGEVRAILQTQTKKPTAGQIALGYSAFGGGYPAVWSEQKPVPSAPGTVTFTIPAGISGAKFCAYQVQDNSKSFDQNTSDVVFVDLAAMGLSYAATSASNAQISLDIHAMEAGTVSYIALPAQAVRPTVAEVITPRADATASGNVAFAAAGTNSQTLTGVDISAATDQVIYMVLQTATGPGPLIYNAPFTVMAPGGEATLTLTDFAFDKMVFDCRAKFGEAANPVAIPLSGTADAGAQIEARLIGESSYTLIATADASGNWTGSLSRVKDDQWHRVEVKIVGNQYKRAETANRFAIGHVAYLMGQSELEYGFNLTYNSYPAPPALSDPDNLTFISYDKTVTNPVPYAYGPDDVEASKFLRFFSNVLAEKAPGEKFMLSVNVEAGTGLITNAMADANTGRSWNRFYMMRDYLDGLGTKASLCLYMWWAADGSYLGANAQGVNTLLNTAAPVWFGQTRQGATFVKGTEVPNTGQNADHFMFDFDAAASDRGRGTFARDEIRFAFFFLSFISPSAMTNSTIKTDGTPEYFLLAQQRTRERWASAFLTDSRGAAIGELGLPANHVQSGFENSGAWIDLSHPNRFNRTGQALMMEMVAVQWLKALGQLTLNPEITGAVWDATGVTLDVQVGAGNRLTTYRAEEGLGLVDPEPHRGPVAGFQYEAGSGTGFVPITSVAITDNGFATGVAKVRVTHPTGLGHKLEYMTGGASGQLLPDDMQDAYHKNILAVKAPGLTPLVPVRPVPEGTAFMQSS